ncbi:hypothetical protein D3C78_1498360 [compost metagenome]
MALAAGQAQATFAQVGLVAVGHFFDEVVGVGNLRSLTHLLGRCARVAVADVLFDRAEKQRRVL